MQNYEYGHNEAKTRVCTQQAISKCDGSEDDKIMWEQLWAQIVRRPKALLSKQAPISASHLHLGPLQPVLHSALGCTYIWRALSVKLKSREARKIKSHGLEQ